MCLLGVKIKIMTNHRKQDEKDVEDEKYYATQNFVEWQEDQDYLKNKKDKIFSEMTPSNILTEFKKLETEINKSFDEEWLELKVISNDTEQAFMKFRELLQLDIDNFNE